MYKASAVPTTLALADQHSCDMLKGVFVWAFFSFSLKKASNWKQTGCFDDWLLPKPKPR
jgi:hypothetical protein